MACPPAPPVTHGAEVAGAGRGVEAQQQPGDGDHVVLHEGLAGQGGRSEAGHPGDTPGALSLPRASLSRPPQSTWSKGIRSPEAAWSGAQGSALPGEDSDEAQGGALGTGTPSGDGEKAPAGRSAASLPPGPADLVKQRVQHADAEDAARGEGQAEHEGQVGAVLPFPLWERGVRGAPAQVCVPQCPAAYPQPRTHARPEPGGRGAGAPRPRRARLWPPRVGTDLSHLVTGLVLVSEVGRAGEPWRGPLPVDFPVAVSPVPCLEADCVPRCALPSPPQPAAHPPTSDPPLPPARSPVRTLGPLGPHGTVSHLEGPAPSPAPPPGPGK